MNWFGKKRIKLRRSVFLAGDCHGQLRALSHAVTDNLLPDNCDVICLGDTGQCKAKYWEGYWKRMDEKAGKRGIRFFLIRGNHDEPLFFRHTNSRQNVILVEDFDEFVYRPYFSRHIGVAVGGAVSVDRSYRWDNNWFWSGNEELPKPPEHIGKKDFILSHTGLTPPAMAVPESSPFLAGYIRMDAALLKDMSEEQDRYRRLLALTGAYKAFYGHYHTSVLFERESPSTGIVTQCRVLDIDELYQMRPWKVNWIDRLLMRIEAYHEKKKEKKRRLEGYGRDGQGDSA